MINQPLHALFITDYFDFPSSRVGQLELPHALLISLLVGIVFFYKKLNNKDLNASNDFGSDSSYNNRKDVLMQPIAGSKAHIDDLRLPFTDFKPINGLGLILLLVTLVTVLYLMSTY